MEKYVLLFFRLLIIILWSFLSIYSLNHFFSYPLNIIFSIEIIGIIGWFTFYLTLIYIGIKRLKEIFIILIFSTSIASFIGPFLEPPSDPLDHIGYINDYCDKKSNIVLRQNRGLIHYSMIGNFVCKNNEKLDLDNTLFRIQISHGLIVGLLLVAIYLVGVRIGLPDKWSLLSLLIAVLFFGTNRFSYFTYYSLGPTSTSILIYWIWIYKFFFQKNIKDILLGLIAFIIFSPIILVNHKQEILFFLFLIPIWIIIFSFEKYFIIDFKKLLINHRLNKNNFYIFVFLVFLVFFVIPFFINIEHYINRYHYISCINGVICSKDASIMLNGVPIFAKLWENRIYDTLGLVGILPVFLSFFLLRPGYIEKNPEYRIRVLIIGILPAIIYCTPLYNSILANLVVKEVYYRVCYSTFFWVTIAYTLYNLHSYISNYIYKNLINKFQFKIINKKTISRFVFTLWSTLFISLSLIKFGPFWGKLPFIFVDTKTLYLHIKPITFLINNKSNIQIISDPITSNIFNSLFGISTNYENIEALDFFTSVNIQDLEQLSKNKNNICIINLRGFPTTWVPQETSHWNSDVASTHLWYKYKNISGNDLKKILPKENFKSCSVFK